jgi:hypothetical protein
MNLRGGGIRPGAAVRRMMDRLSLPGETLAWLLEPGNPSVRRFSLTDILGRPATDTQVRRAARDIMTRGPVPRILARQKPEGCWGRAEDFYARSKYKGTVWTLILLASLGANGSDPRLRRACEFVLRYSQDRKGGGFAYRGTARSGGQPSGVLPCLTGNMTWSLIRLGMIDDPRVRRAVDWMVKYLRFDDGETRPPRGRPYDSFEACWGRHTCFDAVVKPLLALAEIPAARRTGPVRTVIRRAEEFLLRHHLFLRSHDPGRWIKAKWLKLSYPLMWDTDVLEMLLLLSRLGCRDRRLREGLDLVLSKRDGLGRWPADQTLAGRMQVEIDRRGQPSKWVTLRAWSVLRKLDPETVGSGC